MKLVNITPTFIAIFPAIAILPIIKQLIQDLHIGGVETLLRFFSAAINPSLDQIVLSNALNGLIITIATAFLAWFFSIFIGTILGILSSNIFWEIFTNNSYIGIAIRRLLSIPRAIHEVVWGLLLLQILGLHPLVAIIAIVIPYSSIIARVIANQLDSLDNKSLVAINQTGADSASAFITSLIPPLFPLFATYAGYRLECALRGATLLGVFGLGGIGTELQLSLQSLEFNELWSSLWILGSFMFFLEQILSYIRHANFSINLKEKDVFFIFIIISLLIAIDLISLKALDIDLFTKIELHQLKLPTIIELKTAFIQLPLLKLIFTTLLLSVLSAGIAIGIPPLGLMIWPGKIGGQVQSFIWLFFRLIPPPLTALLLLLCCEPSISLAALALGISNIGVMGRLLKDNLSQQNNSLFNAVKSVGAIDQISWLYGKLSPQSKSYLAFSAYRTDVLLRETALVGAVGGIGLGWQLQESLSSFNWAEVAVITFTFITLTLIGESLSDKTQEYWIKGTRDLSLNCSLQT